MMKKLCTLLALFMPFLAVAQEDAWDVYMARYEKGPGSTLFNTTLKQVAPLKEYPYLVKAGVKFTKCSDGLPTDEEFASLNKVSDFIKARMNKLKKNIMAGTFTYQCERNDYYYVTDTAGVRAELLKAFAEGFPGYEPVITIRPDASWEAYLTFLYPNEETREYMANIKVIMKLQEAGDKLEKERQVDHWLYFPNENARKCFVDQCIKNKFKIESKQKLPSGEMPFHLQISRTDKVDISSISAITIELRKQAAKCGGEYDGWETFVIKD